MEPISSSKVQHAISAYRSSSTPKKESVPQGAQKVLDQSVKLTISEEGRRLAAENYKKYSNLRSLKINHRIYH